MISPRIVITIIGEAVLTFPFSRELVDALKDEVPGYARSYDPDTKAWSVQSAYVAVARSLVESVYPDVEVIDFSPNFGRHESRRAAPDASGRTSYTVLHLRETAPPELIEAAFRCLARLHHPDRGGDVATMQRLNAAHAALTKG